MSTPPSPPGPPGDAVPSPIVPPGPPGAVPAPQQAVSNEAIIAANITVSGAATAGAAAATGMLAAAPDAGAAAAAAHAAHLQAVAAQAQAIAHAKAAAASGLTGKAGGAAVGTKAGMGATAIKVAAGAGALIVVGGAIAGGVAAGGDSGQRAPIVEATMDTSVADFDFLNTTIGVPDVFGAGRDLGEVVLTDGSYVFESEDVFENYTYEYTVDPVYADVDGDMDQDAAAVLRLGANEFMYDYLIVWEWRDGKPVQLDRSVAGLCSVESLVGNEADGAFDLKTSSTVAGGDCYGLVADDETLSESFTVSLQGGDLVQTAPVFGSVDRCYFSPYAQPSSTDAAAVTMRVSPDDSAATIDDLAGVTALEWTDNPGNPDAQWVIARATTESGPVCGWLNRADLA